MSNEAIPADVEEPKAVPEQVENNSAPEAAIDEGMKATSSEQHETAEVIPVVTEEQSGGVVEYNGVAKKVIVSDSLEIVHPYSDAAHPDGDVEDEFNRPNDMEDEIKRDDFGYLEKQQPEDTVMRKPVWDEVFVERVSDYSEYSSEEDEGSLSSHIAEQDETLAPDFFTNMKSIQSLQVSNISESVDSVLSRSASIHSRKSLGPDQGSFVDPISGERTHDSSEERKKLEEEVTELKKTKIREDAEEEIEEEESDFELPAEFDQYDKELVIKETEAEEDLVAFLGEVITEVKQEAPIDLDLAAKQRAEVIFESTEKFLRELINAVVTAAEYVDPKERLCKNLNKEELLRAIHEKLRLLLEEHSKCDFLTSKVGQYLKRKHMMQQITKKDETQAAKKFKGALANLDKALGKQAAMKTTALPRLYELRQQLHEKQNELQHTLDEFKNKVRKTFTREDFPYLKAHLEIHFRHMEKQREEISAQRLRYIQAQHRIAVLDKKTNMYEDLGGGLKVSEYDQMLFDAGTFEKRIDEANTELGKKWKLCTNSIHTISHVREAAFMQSHLLEKYQEEFISVDSERYVLRELVFKQRQLHVRLRNELKELIIHSGIGSKPALLHDYDACTDLLQAKKEQIILKRYQYAELMEKVEMLEKEIAENDRLRNGTYM